MDISDKATNVTTSESSESRISLILDDESELAVEAVLFASPDPLGDADVAKIIGRNKKDIPDIIGRLNLKYAQWNRSFRIENFGSKYRYYTLPDFDAYVSRLAELPACLETLET